MIDGAAEGSRITQTVNERLADQLNRNRVQDAKREDRDPPGKRLQVNQRRSGFMGKVRTALLAVGITLGGATVADATGIIQIPGVHEGLAAAGDFLKSKPELKKIESVVPDYILKGSVRIKKGSELRSEPIYPANAPVGGHNSLDFDMLISNSDYVDFENPEVVITWDNKFDLVLRSKDGGAVFTPYRKDLSTLEVSEGATLLEAMSKREHGGTIYFARGIPASEVGLRTGPLEIPAP